MESGSKGLPSFGQDVEFLRQHGEVFVLGKSWDKARVVVSAKYQGKVFTSTFNGMQGDSLGYINYEAFAKVTPGAHMNGFGGENRLWIGPEGGEYSLFFAPNTPQVYANWYTPKAVDTEPWEVVDSSFANIVMRKAMEMKNYKGCTLRFTVEREVVLLEKKQISDALQGANIGGVNCVAYATYNTITNTDTKPWTTETGGVCLWLMDMLPVSDHCVCILPLAEGAGLPAVTSSYFGTVPPNRLWEVPGAVILKADGKYRSKVGVPPAVCVGRAGCYDAQRGVLTVVTFDSDATKPYLNQLWEPNAHPLGGEVLHAYNDGPLEDGTLMGPFLELESSSPAAFLGKEEKLKHTHSVFHFAGEREVLDKLSANLLGVSFRYIEAL